MKIMTKRMKLKIPDVGVKSPIDLRKGLEAVPGWFSKK